MAVLHHAFRCPMTPELGREVSSLIAAWDRGDREGLSAMALAACAALEKREDIHLAFSLSPDGSVSSWLQPEHISPGLAALVVLAPHFIQLPGLSRSHDSNHHLLETQLPLLGWSFEEVEFLVRGRPIETMLGNYASAALIPGGFRHTGGWTPARMVPSLTARFDQSAAPSPSMVSERAREARHRLVESGAFDDARAMLIGIRDGDWLVTSITH